MKTAVPFKDRTDAGRRLAQACTIIGVTREDADFPWHSAVHRLGSHRCMPACLITSSLTPSTTAPMASSGWEGTPILRDRELAEIGRRRQRYSCGRQLTDVSGHTAIVIDDGIATGATTRVALRAIRMRNPKRLVLAVPVAPADTVNELRSDADEVICLEDLGFFGAIGAYYADFSQVSDEDVIDTLKQLPTRRPKESR